MANLKSISVGGGEVAFVDEGEGLPVLFVHGFPLSHDMWQKQIEFFKSRYRVICPDLPGFGRSAPAATLENPALAMDALADWLANFLDSVGCEQPVHFCGLSMGGYVGWEFWKRHASRVRSIIACNTRAADDTELIRRGREIAAKQVFVTGAKPIADAMVKKLFFQGRPDLAETSFYRQIYEVIASTAPESIAAGQRGMAQRNDATEWLSEIEKPMLFVAGEHDVITPAGEMQQDAGRVEHAEYVRLADAGHMSPMESPVEFNSAVERFLASHT